jgi:hypothetical protein
MSSFWKRKTGTLSPQSHEATWLDGKQVIWDTPGLDDISNRDSVFMKEIGLVVDRVQLATAVLLVIRSPARIPRSLIIALEQYIELFGDQLGLVLRIVISDNHVLSADEMELHAIMMADQLSDEVGLQLDPGFLLQIPTGPAPLPPASYSLQISGVEALRRSVAHAGRPILTRVGLKTIEMLVAIRTTIDPKQQQMYRVQLLKQAGRQREVLHVLLSRAERCNAYFDQNGQLLIQTWDMSRKTRALQVLLQHQQDLRLQHRHELRIIPDNVTVGAEIFQGLCLRKKHFSNTARSIRRTSIGHIFTVLHEGGFVLVPSASASPLRSGRLTDDSRDGCPGPTSTESFIAACPTDQVSRRVLGAIADLLDDSRGCPDNVVRLVQSCMAESRGTTLFA